VPDELVSPCEPLLEVTDATAPDILQGVVENYRRFAECQIKYDALRNVVDGGFKH
jgi:hypothetical protein